jgi:hypothetical protein
MHKLNAVPLFAVLAALLAFAGLICANALSAELEGALQYPPREIGEDAQPHRPLWWSPRLYRRGASNWVSAGRACHPACNDFSTVRRSAGMDLERRLQLEVVEVSGVYGPRRVWPAGWRPKTASSVDPPRGAPGTLVLNSNAVDPVPLASGARSSRLAQAPSHRWFWNYRDEATVTCKDQVKRRRG